MPRWKGPPYAGFRLLRTNDPHSMRSFVRMFGLPVVWTYAMNLDRVVRTGEPLGDDVVPGGFGGISPGTLLRAACLTRP